MASYFTNEFRAGLKVLLEGDPCTILVNEFVKPGKIPNSKDKLQQTYTLMTLSDRE